MKRAVIVRGNPGVGKTPILIEIYEWIKSTYMPIVIDEEYYYSIPTDPTSTLNDLFGILQIGSLIVGLCSAGDEADGVHEFLDNCKSNNCDIIVCACRRRGGTYDTIRAELPYPQYVTEYCHPEGLSASLAISIPAAIVEIKARLIGLPL